MVDVARKLDISEAKVTGILEREVETKVDWTKFSQIEILGLDEIALKKGHRDYVTIVTTPVMDKDKGVEILAVLADKKKKLWSNS